MAAPPVLLVADDLAVIASVKRVLAREGYECVLATNAADALIAWGHSLPGLILLQPSVESDRGAVVLEELASHPEARLLRVVLLGESVPGFPWPVEPLPIDPQGFAQTVSDNFRTADRLDGWKVLETTPAQKAAVTEQPPEEPDAWRATKPSQAFSSSETVVEEAVPRLVTVTASLSADEGAVAAEPASGPLEERAAPAADAEPPTPPEGTPRLAPAETSLPDELPEEPTASMAATVPTDEAAAVEAAGGELPPDVGEDEPVTPAPGGPAEAGVSASGTSAMREEASDFAGAAAGSEDAGAAAHEDAASGRAAEPDPAAYAGTAAAGAKPQGSGAPGEAPRIQEGQADSVEPVQAESAPAPERGADEPVTPPEARPAFTPTTDTQYPGVEPPPPEASAEPPPPAQTELADHLFGDLPDLEEAMHRDVEAQVMASVESTLSAPPVDDELQRLEDEVRAEAQRRRIAREEKARAVVTPQPIEEATPSPPPPAAEGAPFESSESDFSGLDEDAIPAAAPAVPAHTAELLSRAEQLMLEGRAAAEARRREAEAEAKRQAAEQEAAARRAEQAEALLQQERDARAEVEEAHERLSEEFDRLTAELELAKTEASETLEQRRAELEGALETTRRELLGVQEELASAIAERDEARHEAEVLSQQLEREAAEARAAREEAARSLAALKGELGAAKEAAEAAAKANEHSLAEAVEQRDEARDALEALTKRAAALEVDLGAATDKLDETIKERDELKSALGVAQGDLERTTGELERSLQEIAGLTRAAEEARAQVAAQAQAMDELRTRAEAAEARAAVAQEKVDTLEKRAMAPLALPGGRVVGVPRTGTVGLDGLARLVGQLVLAQADGRLELGVPGGLRTLWFKRGAVLAAESTLEHESLIDRARRDGLIDARQESELRMLKTATPREQLEALKARGAVRDVEVVPLVQRYTEQTALEAFTESSTNYRLVDEPPSDSVLIAAVPRATLPMLAESLRRAVPPDALLEQLGGGEAVPQPTDAELDLRALGFSERERKMLTWADGEATVEDLSLASGLKPDVAFRALLVAKLLGLIEVRPPKQAAPVVDAELDVRRLEAKYDEVQDADYFTILGLPRTAGAEDVQRAFERLGGEFDPLRFSGHPDPSLQQRAQVVYRLLEEAARALEDDRRRAEYARHLLD
ncbi:MAG: hypothetical protein AB1938_19165 [Myxococcota bacterium]